MFAITCLSKDLYFSLSSQFATTHQPTYVNFVIFLFSFVIKIIFSERNGSDMFVFVINKTKMCKNSPQENKIF